MLLAWDVTCCCHSSLPFLHTAEKGKANATIPKDCGGSWALKSLWTYRQLLLCLPQSKKVLQGLSLKPGCCIHFSFAKAFVLSSSPGSSCVGAWLQQGEEPRTGEPWATGAGAVVVVLPADGVDSAWPGRYLPFTFTLYGGKADLFLMYALTSRTGSEWRY